MFLDMWPDGHLNTGVANAIAAGLIVAAAAALLQKFTLRGEKTTADRTGSNPSEVDEDGGLDAIDAFVFVSAAAVLLQKNTWRGKKIVTDHDGFDPSEVFVCKGGGWVPRNVRRVEVHRSVKFIPDELFRDRRQLEFVRLHDGLLKIGVWAFYGCSSLQCIQIPSTVKEIGKGSFQGCANLMAVDLPAGLKRINNWAFYKCTSLGKVRIPASVTHIGVEAFARCRNLVLAELREGLQIIEGWAFNGCQSLESLCVPLSVVEIGACAFSGCSSLSLVQLQEDLPRMKKFAFRGCPLVSFWFVRLLQRMEAMRMDDRTASMFDSRLREITNAITRDYSDMEAAGIWEKCKKSLVRAHEILDYLQLKGTMPVLELALWKAKMEHDEDDRRRGNLDDEEGGRDARDTARVIESRRNSELCRDDCRIICGTDIVSAEVRRFFADSMSWPRLEDTEWLQNGGDFLD